MAEQIVEWIEIHVICSTVSVVNSSKSELPSRFTGGGREIKPLLRTEYNYTGTATDYTKFKHKYEDTEIGEVEKLDIKPTTQYTVTEPIDCELVYTTPTPTTWGEQIQETFPQTPTPTPNFSTPGYGDFSHTPSESVPIPEKRGEDLESVKLRKGKQKNFRKRILKPLSKTLSTSDTKLCKCHDPLYTQPCYNPYDISSEHQLWREKSSLSSTECGRNRNDGSGESQGEIQFGDSEKKEQENERDPFCCTTHQPEITIPDSPSGRFEPILEDGFDDGTYTSESSNIQCPGGSFDYTLFGDNSDQTSSLIEALSSCHTKDSPSFEKKYIYDEKDEITFINDESNLCSGSDGLTLPASQSCTEENLSRERLQWDELPHVGNGEEYLKTTNREYSFSNGKTPAEGKFKYDSLGTEIKNTSRATSDNGSYKTQSYLERTDSTDYLSSIESKKLQTLSSSEERTYSQTESSGSTLRCDEICSKSFGSGETSSTDGVAGNRETIQSLRDYSFCRKFQEGSSDRERNFSESKGSSKIPLFTCTTSDQRREISPIQERGSENELFPRLRDDNREQTTSSYGFSTGIQHREDCDTGSRQGRPTTSEKESFYEDSQTYEDCRVAPTSTGSNESTHNLQSKVHGLSRDSRKNVSRSTYSSRNEEKLHRDESTFGGFKSGFLQSNKRTKKSTQKNNTQTVCTLEIPKSQTETKDNIIYQPTQSNELILQPIQQNPETGRRLRKFYESLGSHYNTATTVSGNPTTTRVIKIIEKWPEPECDGVYVEKTTYFDNDGQFIDYIVGKSYIHMFIYNL